MKGTAFLSSPHLTSPPSTYTHYLPHRGSLVHASEFPTDNFHFRLSLDFDP